MKLISSILIIAAAIGVFFFFARPELDKINAIKLEEASIEESLAELQELARLRDELLSQYNAVNPVDIARLDKIVPSSIDSGLLIAELESFAQEFNLVLKNISITDETKALTEGKQKRGVVVREDAEQAFRKLPITLQVAGTYVAFRDFLKRLEINTRIIDITEMRFTSKDSDFFEFQVGANTYWTGEIQKAAIKK